MSATTPPAMAEVRPEAVRFEIAVAAIAPDGTRTQLMTMPIPSRCLECGNLLVDTGGSVTASLGTRNGVLGLLCPTHPGVWRR